MKEYFEDEKLTKEGNFFPWTTILGHYSDLAVTKTKASKDYK